MSQASPNLPGLSIISCIECRRRKVKCNRQFPKCQNCIKKHYDCTYPPTLRKTSTKLTKKRKGGNSRFYGFSSVNRSLFEVGMPFCNVDFELESKNAPSQTERFTSSNAFKTYIENPQKTLSAIDRIRGSISASYFDEMVDLSSLELALCSRQGSDYQTLLLSYAVVIISERFYDSPPDVDILLNELNIVLDQCPDCPEKVSSLVLLADYYHFNFKIETAWKCTFLATSIAYALGLHTSSSKVWAMLVLNDALLCSVVGRPTSIKSVNSKLICRLCDGWGEIAYLLRDCNEVLLNLKSEDSIEKVISLDMKYDDFIERTKKTMKCSSGIENPELMLLGYLKICIMTAIRIKLLFPVFPKHRTIKTQLDENCSALTHCLRGLFQFLTESGLASEQKPFSIRSQFFPAYCSMFQGFLLQFLFTSNEILGKPDITTDESSNAYFPRNFERKELFMPSLASIVSLIHDYESIAKNISFCSFMTDVFESFRVLLNQKKRSASTKMLNEPTRIDSSHLTPKEQNVSPILPDDLNEPEMSDKTSPLMTDDIAEWITSCFSEGITYLYPAERTP